MRGFGMKIKDVLIEVNIVLNEEESKKETIKKIKKWLKKFQGHLDILGFTIK